MIAELLGTTFTVNSYHHQAVKEIGRGLKVTSRAMDGVIESVEMEGEAFVLAVQWHPEMMMASGDDMLPLFLRLVEEAEGYRRNHEPVRGRCSFAPGRSSRGRLAGHRHPQGDHDNVRLL